jgi:hypothetical protein
MAINVQVKHIVTIVAIISALGVIAYVVSSLYHLSDTVQGAIVGGIIGFGSSIGVKLVQAYTTRPILSISERITYWGIGEENSMWFAARIIVENNGSTAAEDCKASLIDLDADPPIQTRVGWMIPKDDFTVTINAHDTESIDLCAMSINPKGKLIITTENGYRKRIEDGYSYTKQITGQLKVSASNAKQCVKKIWISPVLDHEKKYVYLSRPENWPPKPVSSDDSLPR